MSTTINDDARNLMLKLADTTLMTRIRGAALIGLSLVTVVIGSAKQFDRAQSSLDPVTLERRLTITEEAVRRSTEDIKELKYINWLMLAIISGLGGEAGLRMLRKKRGEG